MGISNEARNIVYELKVSKVGHCQTFMIKSSVFKIKRPLTIKSREIESI